MHPVASLPWRVSLSYWNGWNIAAALLQYADAMAQGPDPALAARCNKAVLDYVREVHRRMLTTPTTSWSQNRWQDWVYIVHWLLDQAPQGEEQMLWDAAELTQQQSWDWDAYYDQTGTGRTSQTGLSPVRNRCSSLCLLPSARRQHCASPRNPSAPPLLHVTAARRRYWGVQRQDHCEVPY